MRRLSSFPTRKRNQNSAVWATLSRRDRSEPTAAARDEDSNYDEKRAESVGSPLVNTSSRCEVVNEKLNNGFRVSRKSPTKKSRESYKLGDMTDIKNTD